MTGFVSISGCERKQMQNTAKKKILQFRNYEFTVSCPQLANYPVAFKFSLTRLSETDMLVTRNDLYLLPLCAKNI